MGNPVFPSIYSEADMSKFDFNEYGCNVDSVRDIVTGFWEKYPEMEENRIGLYIWSKIKVGRKVLGVFEKYGISFEHMPSGIDTMAIMVHQDEFEEYEQSVIAGIHRAVEPDLVDLESDLALIAVVGRGMKGTRGTVGRIFSALAHARINVKMIDQGSSELNIIIGVKNSDFETAIKAIYDIFITAAI